MFDLIGTSMKVNMVSFTHLIFPTRCLILYVHEWIPIQVFIPLPCVTLFQIKFDICFWFGGRISLSFHPTGDKIDIYSFLEIYKFLAPLVFRNLFQQVYRLGLGFHLLQITGNTLKITFQGLELFIFTW